MSMRIPRTDYEQDRPGAGVTEEEFHKRKDLKEGINGCDRINTRFENTERVQVLAPRGDKRGRPHPRDAKWSWAGNHGEWGPDQFHESLERGMDGPNETRWSHGMGLPKRVDLDSNANPQFGGAGDAFTAAESNPQDQGFGSKNP